jgi:Protein of unknown function (DUF1360)
MASQVQTGGDGVAREVQAAVGGYAPGEERPLGSYVLLTGAFGAALAGAFAVAKRSGREVDRPGALDIALAGLATQKVSRLLAKDKVTSFLRAPFTRFEEPSGHGELSEEPRGSGMRYAVGELLVCPYCLGQWVAGGFAVGWVYAPRATRLLAAMWAAESVADAAQIAYSAAEQSS